MTSTTMPAAKDMSCGEVMALVTEYLEGALTNAERDRFVSHIAACDGCTGYVEQIRTTIRVTGVALPEALSPEARQQLVDAFRGWKEQPQAPARASLTSKLRKLLKR
jgi:anti-sigma factor RsiW